MQVQENTAAVEKIGEVLLNPSRPLKERFRALFTLRNINGPLSVKLIEECFNDSSALLKHECAYCLGQMKNILAIPKLISVLENLEEEPIVRHEAAEALAAIGDEKSLPILKKYLDDPCIEVSETCQLAIHKLEESENISDALPNPYKSIDPAPPLPKTAYKSIEELEKILLNESESLYKRYKAMFTLRNIGTDDSALALAKGLKCGSALFRHEVAYVLGQMQNVSTVKQLTTTLVDENEHEMVRHECAEALGAIATDECMTILNNYLKDDKRVVRESCIIAVDMCEYENSQEFQYANALVKAM